MDALETTEVKIQLVAAAGSVSLLIHLRAIIDFCSEPTQGPEKGQARSLTSRIPQSSGRSIMSTVTAKTQARRVQRDQLGANGYLPCAKHCAGLRVYTRGFEQSPPPSIYLILLTAATEMV